MTRIQVCHFFLKRRLSSAIKTGTEAHKNPTYLFLVYLFMVVQCLWTKKEEWGAVVQANL